ncbi:MAG: hypothetical protein HYU38_10820 [Candidatus Tectomicrobia bacterium]|nr:hypothetical protein [Candidatus Tectomicrobia bacterium]
MRTAGRASGLGGGGASARPAATMARGTQSSGSESARRAVSGQKRGAQRHTEPMPWAARASMRFWRAAPRLCSAIMRSFACLAGSS